MSTVPAFPNIGLKPTQLRAAARRAREEGKTPSEYLRSLVERDLLAGGSIDEALRPMRAAFSKGRMSEGDLDRAVTEARREIHARSGRKGGR
jgi:hypothetical protein